jgi:hypothetical protein
LEISLLKNSFKLIANARGSDRSHDRQGVVFRTYETAFKKSCIKPGASIRVSMAALDAARFHTSAVTSSAELAIRSPRLFPIA